MCGIVGIAADKFLFYKTKQNDQRIKLLKQNRINFITSFRGNNLGCLYK